MFAGVAASSMPTVRQFFASQDISLPSWTSPLKSSFTYLLRSSAREKIPDHNPSVTEWAGNNLHTSEDHDRLRMEKSEPGWFRARTEEADSDLRLADPSHTVHLYYTG